MTKLLKFDRARFDAGEMPTRMRNGRTVLRVVDSGLDVPYPLSTWVEGLRRPLSHTCSGRVNGGYLDPFDLVHEPRKTKVTVGLRRSDKTVSGVLHTAHPDEIERWREAGLLIAEHTFEIEED